MELRSKAVELAIRRWVSLEEQRMLRELRAIHEIQLDAVPQRVDLLVPVPVKSNKA